MATHGSAKDTIDRSRSLIDEGRVEDAAEILRVAVSDYPEDAEVRLLTSAAVASLDSTEEAKGLTREAAKLAWDDPGRLTWAASQMLTWGEPDEARQLVNRVYEIAPDDFEMTTELTHLTGKLALVYGDEDGAERLLRMSFEAEPGGSGYARTLAVYLTQQSRLIEALEVVQEGLRHRADDADLVHLRGELEGAMGGSPDSSSNGAGTDRD
jgi:Flp pilus assembly protein TadD